MLFISWLRILHWRHFRPFLYWLKIFILISFCLALLWMLNLFPRKGFSLFLFVDFYIEWINFVAFFINQEPVQIFSSLWCVLHSRNLHCLSLQSSWLIFNWLKKLIRAIQIWSARDKRKHLCFNISATGSIFLSVKLLKCLKVTVLNFNLTHWWLIYCHLCNFLILS